MLLLIISGFQQVNAQTSWVSRTAPANSGWSAITYGNGQFVALAYIGDTASCVMTSPDGNAWTLRSAPAQKSWWSVTYGNGLYVAVGSGGTSQQVMTSPDGISWTLQNTPEQNDWQSVTYGNGLFVAVAPHGLAYKQVMTSPDGINWTLRTSAATNNWSAVAYGNGTFVAVAASGFGNRVMTSPDGINWTIRSSASNDGWEGLTYGNGLFVAVSSGGVMTSPDGITWTFRTPGAYNSWRSVTYGNGHFVAVASWGSSGNRVLTSTDGITWTPQASAADNTWYSVAYGDGTFAAVSASGPGDRIMISTCNTSRTDTVVSCTPFTWIDGNTYTGSNNTATYTVPNAAGCDSVIRLNLTIPLIDATVSVQDSILMADVAGAAYQWIDCDQDNAPINGADGQSYTAAATGHYAVIVTRDGCSDTSDCVAVTIVPPVAGITDAADDAAGISLYPNPTHTCLKVNAQAFAGRIEALQLIDMQGRTVARYSPSGPEFMLPLTRLPAGIYAVHILTNKGVLVRKVTIQ